ncbi:suppressor of fused domain protein [Polyangium fumosum]|uniref:Suppressor of fused-like domain-containing protein n=1 Tax=Polyangium fumosum TaxID=889272 RepID=A0A4U1IV07_9BACT|nr:suppressor of fused domain protein [Polyangium fumosum]TKC98293.1 hypothetical protein E8A74_41715 [Polyangium fumosum]
MNPSELRAAVAAHFERHLGRGQLVLRGAPGGLFIPRHLPIYGAPPCEGRTHWVLRTIGASLRVLEGRKGEERRFEFVMSLPDDWIPSEKWPAYMFQRASAAILTRGLAPEEGGVVFNSAETVHGSPHVFALLVAPSRQFGQHAAFRTLSGTLVEVYAMWPLTFDEWQLHQGRCLNTATLPEVIEHWRDMLR